MATKKMTFRLHEDYVKDTVQLLKRAGCEANQTIVIEVGLAALRNFALAYLDSDDETNRERAKLYLRHFYIFHGIEMRDGYDQKQD